MASLIALKCGTLVVLEIAEEDNDMLESCGRSRYATYVFQVYKVLQADVHGWMMELPREISDM